MLRLISAAGLVVLLLGCNRGKDEAVTIVPREEHLDPNALPRDPFGASSAAYTRLREVTDAALALPWSGKLDDFAPWLEEQTSSVEHALGLLKALRIGAQDVYAVANGRIALVYETIATALTEASALAQAEGHDADWKDQQGRIWEQANAFWARCARGCSASGAHLDAWDLRCGHGVVTTQAKLQPSSSPRQPK